MIDLLRAWQTHTAYGRRIFGFAGAFVIAEMFYKFHSFTLECLAFLATWLVFDLVIEMIAGKPQPQLTEPSSDHPG